jgi:hypothetical protein
MYIYAHKVSNGPQQIVFACGPNTTGCGFGPIVEAPVGRARASAARCRQVVNLRRKEPARQRPDPNKEAGRSHGRTQRGTAAADGGNHEPNERKQAATDETLRGTAATKNLTQGHRGTENREIRGFELPALCPCVRNPIQCDRNLHAPRRIATFVLQIDTDIQERELAHFPYQRPQRNPRSLGEFAQPTKACSVCITD